MEELKDPAREIKEPIPSCKLHGLCASRGVDQVWVEVKEYGIFENGQSFKRYQAYFTADSVGYAEANSGRKGRRV